MLHLPLCIGIGNGSKLATLDLSPPAFRCVVSHAGLGTCNTCPQAVEQPPDMTSFHVVLATSHVVIGKLPMHVYDL